MGKGTLKVAMCPCRGSDPASGHPRAQKLPSGNLVPLLSLPGPSLPSYTPFLSVVGCANGAPQTVPVSLLHAPSWVHIEEDAPCHWPGASKQTPHTGGGGTR